MDEAAQAEITPIERLMRSRSDAQVRRLAENESAAPKMRQAAIADLQRRMETKAQPTTTSPLQQTATRLNVPALGAAQAPNTSTNSVTNVQTGTQQTKTGDSFGGRTSAAPGRISADNQPQEASQFDVSKRTDLQLTYLSRNGQPGWRESAAAELQRRGMQVAPAATSNAAPATPEATKAANREKLAKAMAVKQVAPVAAEAAQGSKEPWQMTRHEWYSAKNNDRAETFGAAGKRNGAAETAARIERKARLNYGVAETGEPVDHRQVIEKAMAEGKPVPATVLATYP
ncbi:MAG: hypothetical protein JNK92_10075, partial [Dechloromonas sp.]|nr:hypothetical protein [Dechloromonas sp.]